MQNNSTLLSGINNDLGSLSSAINALTDVLGPLTAETVSSSQPSIVTGTAQPSATPGTHTIVVSTLATQGTLYTQPVADANTSILPSGATTGDLQLQIGGASGTTQDISITAGSNDTLNTLVSYINSQNLGVTATVLNDATGARLAIYSQNTGDAGALAITNNTTTLAFNDPVGGTNATFTVDGITFSSTTNTVSGAIPGVTVNLQAAFPGIQAQLSVGPDTAAATQAIGTFISAYNKVIGDINQQFTVDPSTNTEGPLGSDSTLRALQSSLLSDVTYSTGSGAFSDMSALGITMNNDGTLNLDAGQLSSALASNPSAVLNFFQNSNQTGFANNFANGLQNLTDPATGLLNLDLTQNQQQQLDLTNTVNGLQDRITAEQQQLITQFSQVNALIEEFPFLSQAIDLQLGIQPKGSGNTSPAGSTGG